MTYETLHVYDTTSRARKVQKELGLEGSNSEKFIGVMEGVAGMGCRNIQVHCKITPKNVQYIRYLFCRLV
jgi:hypothetical protein